MQNFAKAAVATLAFCTLAGTAGAQQSYIEHIGPQHTSASSIDVVTCPACPPLEAAEEAARFQAFDKGMVSEIRIIDGERKVVRTDNMWGGSPVTTIVSAGLVLGDLIPANLAETGQAPATTVAALPHVDQTTVTSSLDGPRQALTPDDFDLRLN